jgi:hypothetical protein
MLRECIVLNSDNFRTMSDTYREMDLSEQNNADVFLATLGIKLVWSPMWERYQLQDVDYDPDLF